MTARAVKKPFRITGWHVLVSVVAFFGVVIAVDSLFLVLAYRSHPGQVSVTPYEDGLAYNRAVAQRRAQAAMGWTATAAPGWSSASPACLRPTWWAPTGRSSPNTQGRSVRKTRRRCGDSGLYPIDIVLH